MQSHLDSIPQAVATIIASCASKLVPAQSSQDDADKETMMTRVVYFTDQLTRTFVRALEDAEVEDDDDEQPFGR